jgi:hypothetical protein
MKFRALLSLPLLILVTFLGCSCREEVISTASSPDGLHTAAVLSKDCGAATSEYTSVTVRPGLGSSGAQVVFAARYPQRIGLSWKSPSELVVRCDSCRDEQITFQLLREGTLRISYELP